MRLIKALLVLAVLGFAAIAGFAYFGEFTPDADTHTAPVALPGLGDGN